MIWYTYISFTFNNSLCTPQTFTEKISFFFIIITMNYTENAKGLCIIGNSFTLENYVSHISRKFVRKISIHA